MYPTPFVPSGQKSTNFTRYFGPTGKNQQISEDIADLYINASFLFKNHPAKAARSGPPGPAMTPAKASVIPEGPEMTPAKAGVIPEGPEVTPAKAEHN